MIGILVRLATLGIGYACGYFFHTVSWVPWTAGIVAGVLLALILIDLWGMFFGDSASKAGLAAYFLSWLFLPIAAVFAGWFFATYSVDLSFSFSATPT